MTDELTVRKNNLPVMVTGEVKKFVDDISLAIDAIKAKRTAAGRYGFDKTSIDEMDEQIVQLSAIKLEALVELGGRTAEMETLSGNRTDLIRTVEEVKTKSDQLKELGIAPQRATENEKMFHNKEIVDQYIADSVANGKVPSKRGVLREIDRKESYVEIDSMGGVKTKSDRKGVDPRTIREEAKKRDSKIAEAINGLVSKDASNYSIDDLVHDIVANGENAVSSLKMFLESKLDLFQGDEERKMVSKAIDESYWRKVVCLKGELNL